MAIFFFLFSLVQMSNDNDDSARYKVLLCARSVVENERNFPPPLPPPPLPSFLKGGSASQLVASP